MNPFQIATAGTAGAIVAIAVAYAFQLVRSRKPIVLQICDDRLMETSDNRQVVIAKCQGAHGHIGVHFGLTEQNQDVWWQKHERP